MSILVNWGADKSLAQPWRKQATATKLSFASHSKKKNSEGCLSNQISATAVTSASEEKWRPFNCFFQSDRAKDLSAPLYMELRTLCLKIYIRFFFFKKHSPDERGGGYKLPDPLILHLFLAFLVVLFVRLNILILSDQTQVTLQLRASLPDFV